MKKMPIIASILIGAISLTAFSTTYAWKMYENATADALCGDVLNEPIISENNDVVTTDKWNKLACYVWKIGGALADFGRLETPFIWGSPPSNIWGKTASVIVGIGLGYVSGEVPFVNFYNGNYGYMGAFSASTSVDRHALGSIAFRPKDSSYDDSLRFEGFNGGLYVSPGANAASLSKNYIIGWERVNLTDTVGFDTECTYRVTTNDGFRLTPVITTSGYLGFYADKGVSLSQMLGPTFPFVQSNAKNILGHKVSGDTAYGTSVTRIEKFCLPSYNPNNY